MPELPEVETIRIELNELIKNKKIKSVKINLVKQVQGSVTRFKKLVVGSQVVSVERRAKNLIINLDNHYHLIFHLKMTGQLIWRKRTKVAGGGHPIKQDLQELPNKYSHVIFEFNDNSNLFFNDTRQFGWVKIINDQELEELNQRLGPEPLAEDFKVQDFIELFKNKKQAIKPILLDQKFIAGIGNIYAAEAVFCAGIKPTRRTNEISKAEFKKLYICLRRILKQAVNKKGTSSKDYVDAFGRQGSMNNYLKVYGRAGETCVRCGHVLKQIEQGQRTTVYCPSCQK